MALLDAAGATQTSYTYSPFGETTTAGAASSNNSQYTGRESDGATGFYFYRARYYWPTLQRFISEDPIGFRGGINFYAYIKNSPMNFIDPYNIPSMAKRKIESLLGCWERGIRDLHGFPYP